MATIYELKCLITNYSYIGCTDGKLGKRMREHRCLLNSGKHKCTKLQYDWEKYGKNSFCIQVLEDLPDANLIEKREAELRWMKVYEGLSLLYNLYVISFRPDEEARKKGVSNAHKSKGKRWTPEVNEKRRLAQIGKPKGHGAKISATKRANRMR